MADPLNLVDIPNFMPANLPSLSQAERTAFTTQNAILRNFMVAPNFRSMLSFDHKQDGIDYFLAHADFGLQATPGDMFLSTGLDGPGNGDTGVPSLWIYSTGGLSWMAWDLDIISYSPSVATLSVGNGLTTAHFMRMGRMAYVDWGFVLGSTSTFTGGPIVDLPSESNSDLDYTLEAETPLGPGGAFAANQGNCGSFEMVDASPAGGYHGFSRIESATAFRGLRVSVSGAATLSSSLNASLPFVWAQDDVMTMTMTYVLAN
jgi:hypothetical protein